MNKSELIKALEAEIHSLRDSEGIHGHGMRCGFHEALGLVKKLYEPPAVVSAWQPINTAPRDYTWVLIAAFESDNKPDCIIASRWEGFWQMWKGKPPTHWQPLPTPPAKE